MQTATKYGGSQLGNFAVTSKFQGDVITLLQVKRGGEDW